jgi:hypothetical protein
MLLIGKLALKLDLENEYFYQNSTATALNAKKNQLL